MTAVGVSRARRVPAGARRVRRAGLLLGNIVKGRGDAVKLLPEPLGVVSLRLAQDADRGGLARELVDTLLCNLCRPSWAFTTSCFVGSRKSVMLDRTNAGTTCAGMRR